MERTRFTASVIEPAHSMWLSLMSILSDRLYLCGDAPPIVIEYFSSILHPGVVFLVSVILALVSLIFSTYVLVIVAIPEAF